MSWKNARFLRRKTGGVFRGGKIGKTVLPCRLNKQCLTVCPPDGFCANNQPTYADWLRSRFHAGPAAPPIQLDDLARAGCERIFQEKVSSAKARPQLGLLVDSLRAGDTVVVWKLGRLGRSMKELITLINEFQNKEVGFQSLNDAIDTTTAQGRLVFNLFASLAEFDRTGEPAGLYTGTNPGGTIGSSFQGSAGRAPERVE